MESVVLLSSQKRETLRDHDQSFSHQRHPRHPLVLIWPPAPVPLVTYPFLADGVLVATDRQTFRFASLFWWLLDLMMAFMFLLVLMTLTMLLITMQLTLYFVISNRGWELSTIFMYTLFLTFPIVCASISVALWRLMWNAATAYEFTDLRLFVHLLAVRPLQSPEDGPPVVTIRTANLLLTVLTSLPLVALLPLPLVAGVAAAISSHSLSEGLRYLLIFGITAAAAVAALSYTCNVVCYLKQILDAVNALQACRRRTGYRRALTYLEYAHTSTEDLIATGMDPEACTLVSLDLYIDRCYGIYRNVAVMDNDAVAGWLTIRMPDFGPRWFLHLLCLLLAIVLAFLPMINGVHYGEWFSGLNGAVAIALGLKIAATLTAVAERNNTTAAVAVRAKGAALWSYRIVMVMLGALSLGLVWALALRVGSPRWIHAAVFPAILVVDVWALWPLFGAYGDQTTEVIVSDKLRALWGRHRFAWQVVKGALAYYIILSYLVLGLAAAFASSFSTFLSGALFVSLATLTGTLVFWNRIQHTTAHRVFCVVHGAFACVLLLGVLTAELRIQSAEAFAPNGDPAPPTALNSRYGVCSQSWGPDDEALIRSHVGILDFAFLNYLSNMQNASLAARQMAEWFPADWRLQYRSTGGLGLPHFDHYIHLPTEMSVVIVRGTQTVGDAIQDLYLWAPALILQSFTVIVPILRHLPPPVLRWLVELGSFEEWIDIFSQPVGFGYQNPIREYVAANCSLNRTILTGHSLGGAVASVVGVQTNLAVVAFSSPGISYSAKKFRLSEEHITTPRSRLLTVQPFSDPIAMVDAQLGEVQAIGCARHGIPCHYLSVTIEELLRTCGDSRGRRVYNEFENALLDVQG